MRAPLVDGQGNFGSVDGDDPAAMRYTEARRAKIAHSLTEDIDKETVDFQDNYDGSEREPVVLPARYPNLLVNGASGIAVGMATNVPPHNLGEVIDACLAYMDDPSISMEALTEIVPGPDFPTRGLLIGKQAARAALARGRGSILMRARCHVEEIRKDREAIIATELPYQVNKARLLERIADLVRDKRIEGIGEIRDESDRHGMRVVIELKRDASSEVVLNQLYRFSELQTTFGVNMLALNNGRPMLMSLKDMIGAFTAFREEVVTKRTRFELGKARDRGHILVGLATAVANIDEVIATIRKAPDAAAAREALMTRDWPAKDVAPLVALIADPRHVVSEAGTIRLSEEQAKAILDIRLQRLTALGRDEIADEATKLGTAIADYLDILRSRPRVLQIVRTELTAIRDEFATPRQTELIDADVEIEDEALIEREDVAVTITHAGYIKRTPIDEYRVQGRGGKGRAGMSTREEDFVTNLFVASTHAPLVFFSSTGMAYKLKVWRLPEARIQGKGKAMVNLLPLSEGERITTVLPLPEDESQWEKFNVVFATKSGDVRRNELSDFVSINRNGKIAMKLEPGDKNPERADLHRARRCAAHHAVGQMYPLCVDRCARVQGARLYGRARHQAGEWRRSRQPFAATPFRCVHAGSACLSQAGFRRAPGCRRGGGRRRCGRRRGRHRGSHAFAGALRGAWRARAVRARDVRKRLRQAHVVLRIPRHRARWFRYRRAGHGQEEFRYRCRVPGGGFRRPHAHQRSGADDPRAGERHFGAGPRCAGRHRVPGR
jgi:DNA gyrase subunit A